MSDASYPGQASLGDLGSIFATQQFLIKQMLGRMWTISVAQVVSCTNDGSVAGVGFVNIQPMVAAVDVAGTVQAHDTIYNVPYLRIQGGKNAIIIDPAKGDIGLVAHASRDISSVKSSRMPSAPASFRRFDPADAIYLGGILNGVPTQYVQFSSDGITVVSPTLITLHAPTISFEGNVTASNTIVADGEITGNGIELSTHTHDGVATGSGDTGEPNP